MAVNHRCVLRISTDLALGIFFLFFIGALLWVIDEFLGWDVLPAWIETYAQLIIIVMGAAAGLAIASSLLCSIVVIAEAAAERVGIQDYRISGKTWRMLGLVVALFTVSLIIFSKIDAHRKELFAKQHREKAEASYHAQVRDLQAAIPTITNLFSPELVSHVDFGSTTNTAADLVRFFSAVRASIPHRPEVSLLIRAEPPYEYCRLKLATRRDSDGAGGDRYYIDKQFYFGFPTELETRVVRQLLAGQIEAVESRLEGEVINNVRPSAWGLVRSGREVIGLLVIENNNSPGFGLFHFGPARSM